MNIKILVFLFLNVYIVLITAARQKRDCKPVTTCSGSAARQHFCPGDIIFEDNFDSLDLKKWQHEISMYGGGNHEFQWYTNDKNNSFTNDGKLFIRPSLTSDYLGNSDKLYRETIDLGSSCTTPWAENGCKRTGTSQDILNPIRSARLHTVNSFAFKYGRVEIIAKVPTGDWLWPALWFMPRDSKYGSWPRSGEIDLMESRGNKNLTLENKNIGTATVSSTMHWGPNYQNNEYWKTHYEQYNPKVPYNTKFYKYELMWTPDYIRFSVNGQKIGTADPRTSFWDFGEFSKKGFHDNIWASGGKMAPFDQEFFIIFNLAVGGTKGFFPDHAKNYPYEKPWKNNAPHAMTDFWNARNNWLPTWKLRERGGYEASFVIDSVRIWAI